MAEAPPMSLMNVDDDSTPSFVKLDEKYKCCICRRALKSPVQTECGHRMCKPCIESLFHGKNNESISCPGKEETCVLLTPTSREMLKLLVSCKNSVLGCPEKCLYRELANHMSVCAFIEQPCSYRDLGCTARLTRKIYDKHIYQDCEFLPTECQFCKMNKPKKFLTEHIELECEANRTPCKYGCGYENSRKEMIQHEKECRRRPTECKFKSYGCTFIGSEGEVKDHLRKEPHQHVGLLEDCVGTSSEKVSELQNIVDVLSKENAALKETIRRRDKVIDTQERKIRDIQKAVASQGESIHSLHQESNNYVKKDQIKQFERQMISLRDSQFNLETKVRSFDERQASVRAVGDMQQRAMTLDRQVGIMDVRLAEMDLRFQCLETCSYSGVLVWKITDYTRRKREAVAGTTMSHYSQPFYTSRYGYKMCARAYLNGDGAGRNSHLSVYFVVMRGEYDNLLSWPFKQRIVLSVLDQKGGRKDHRDTFRPDPSSSSFRKPISEMNVAAGCPRFLAQSIIEKPPYLVDDTVFLKVTVDTNDLPVH